MSDETSDTARDQTGEQQESGQKDGGRATVIAALSANAGIAVTKFIAAALSGSSAMFVEGIHSVVDTGNQACLLLGMKRAKKPADAKHPFGYGAELYFWSFIVAVLLFALGAGLSVWEGVRALLHGESEGGGVPWIPYIVLAIAFVFESYALQKAVRHFNKTRRGQGLWSDLRETKDPSIFVVLCEDTAALLGILIAALGVTLHWQLDHPFWDAAASILIGVLLGLVAIFLANEVRGLLVGESADPDMVADLRSDLTAREEVDKVNDIRSLHFGPHDVLVTISVDFHDDVRAGRIEEIVTECERRTKKKYDVVRRLFLEVQDTEEHARLEGERI